MFFFSNKPKIAVLTPFEDLNCSPLYPYLKYAPGKKWTYYDLCLRTEAQVKYLPLEKHHKVKGYKTVYIHENLYDKYPDQLIEILSTLKRNNDRLIWVELHEKSLFSEAIFKQGFWEQIDLVLKHQLLEFDILKAELAKPLPHIGPYQLFGSATPLPYFRRWFGFTFSDEILQKHAAFDFNAQAHKIQPLMFPFSYPLIEKGFPSYSSNHPKKQSVGYSGRQAALAHLHRNFVCASLLQHGIPLVDNEKDYVGTLRHSEYFLALGHIHSSLRTFDTLAFDTVLVHYGKSPYRMWPEFKEYETFLPLGNIHALFQAGGLGYDQAAIHKTAQQFALDLQDTALKQKLLVHQKELFHQLIHPKFINQKLGFYNSPLSQ
jgi:hypothetical protein